MDKEIFVSYSRKDIGIVDTIVQHLEAQGYSIWIDRSGIVGGDAFKKLITHAIENCKVVLFFSSCDSNKSEWTAKEIGVAVHEKKHIIPILLDKSKLITEVKFDLINQDFLDFTDRSLFNESLLQLEKALSVRCSHNTGSREWKIPDNSRKKRPKKWLALTRKLFLACSIIIGMITLYFLSNYIGLFTYKGEDWKGNQHDYNHIFDLIVGGNDFNMVLVCLVLSCIVSAYIAYKINLLSNKL